MTSYWKTYWDQHVEGVPSDDPFRQVLRVQNKQPISEAAFRAVGKYVVEKLELADHHRVLDLCCGNGLLSAAMAAHCDRVIGVDFSEKLIQDIALRGATNITGIASDVLDIRFQPAAFDRILFAAALQHFSQAQVIRLFKDLASWLKPGGILLVTDILDSNRMWHFFDSQEREDVYFSNELAGTSLLGTWFDSLWLKKLARHAGFSEAKAMAQPSDFLYSRYRFDMLCRK